jgi:TRAP-type uncharacterized transport system fused permease subunit
MKAGLALTLWGAAAIGYGRAPLTWWERTMAAIAAGFLVLAIPVTDEVGFGLTVLIVLGHMWRTRSRTDLAHRPVEAKT